MTDKAFEKVRADAVHSFLDEHLVEMEVHLHKQDQASLFSDIKAINLEGKQPCTSQYVKSELGNPLRDKSLILQRWVRYLSALNMKSANMDPISWTKSMYNPNSLLFVDELKIDGVKFALLKVANGKAVGPDDLS